MLEKLAEADPDDLPLRKKLAQLAVARRDWPAAERWTGEALQIQVMDADLHAWQAQAFSKQQKPAAAAEEFSVAVELNPDDPQLRMQLAQSLIDADQRDAARKVLDELLQRAADHPGARQLRESLK